MPFDYSYVLTPTGQPEAHIVREMFDDIKEYLNTSLGGGAPANATFVTITTNATLTNERVLTGTANQVIITDNGAGSTLVLSLPQSIATSSNVEFNRLNLSVGTTGSPSLYFDGVGSGSVVYGLWAEASGSGGFLNISGGGTTFVQFANAVSAFSSSVTALAAGFEGSEMRFRETGGGSDNVTVKAPASLGATYTLTLPTDDGASGEVLSTNGSGVLSWIAAGSGANTALSNLASVAINTTLVSDTDNTDDLGTSTINWKDVYIKGALKTGTTNLHNILDGSAGSPAIRFGPRNSGFYTDSANNINFTAGGSACAFFAVANSYFISNLNSNTSAGSNLGGATEYWNDVSYKTLTDRGCLPWCDDGVEMSDGKRLSDVEAICAIQKHPTQKTVHGLPKLDYSTFPKHAYKTVESEMANVRRDAQGRAWVYSERQGKEIEAQDGVEMTMMFGVLIGAIKELKAEIETLKSVR